MKHGKWHVVLCGFLTCALALALVPTAGIAQEISSDAMSSALENARVDEVSESKDVQTDTKERDVKDGQEDKDEEQEEQAQSEASVPKPVSEAQIEEATDSETATAAEGEHDEEPTLVAQSKASVDAFLSGVSESTVAYKTHVQTYGWQDFVTNGKLAGTTGESKRLEAIEIGVRVPGVSGGVRYRVHRQTYGWENDWSYDGEISGTTGEAKRLEAIYIELTGDLAQQYDIYYHVHVQDYGWQDWVKNGELAGTTGEAKRLEAIEIKLVYRGENHIDPINGALVNYTVHAQTYGWLKSVADGTTSGTTGEAKRLEGIQIKLGSKVDGGIRYLTHVQTYGWESDWSYDGATAGTTGESKRLEAIKIELTGKAASTYDVWYRVHSQTYGWLGWARNGESAGTSGRSKRLEAIQIVIQKKGSTAPGSTSKHMIENSYIYLDAGHGLSGGGEYDPGASGCGYQEADLTKELVTLMVDYAKKNYGLDVYSNIGCDKHYSKRQLHAQSVGATSLVSIHFNAVDSSAAHGIESYIYQGYGQYVGVAGPRSNVLQKIMHTHLTGALPLFDRGMKTEAFSVINAKDTNLPSTLLEVCFITNPGDMQTYQARKQEVAKALAAGLNEAVSQGF